jgi:hypothetical protein
MAVSNPSGVPCVVAERARTLARFVVNDGRAHWHPLERRVRDDHSVFVARALVS